MSHDSAITELSARVVEAARASRIKIVTAESCTAGALATLLADTPGAGDVYLGGFVTYSKLCKTDVLDISPSVIDRHSAVSAEVVEAMARGAIGRCPSADIAVAVTCVCGPKPDDDGNPVGVAHLAVFRRGQKVDLRELQIERQSPGRVRGEVLYQALQLLLEVFAREA